MMFQLNRHGFFLRLGWYLLCCALVTKLFVLQILTIDIHQWGQSKGSSNSKYEGVSISYQPDLFLTDRYSQVFHSLFGHRIKTLLQCLSIVGWLVDNLS